MRIIGLSTLKAFYEGQRAPADARTPILAWHQFALAADWATPAHATADFVTASILRDGRAVFNLGGNKYRLVVWISYPHRVVCIRFRICQ